MSEILKAGCYYARKDIHKILGGGVQDFLPHKDGIVVCICVSPEMNPHLPETILVGEGMQVPHLARVFSQQTNYIPMFAKRDSNKWEYIGDFRVKSISDDEKEIARHKSYSGRDDVELVLHLEKNNHQNRF